VDNEEYLQRLVENHLAHVDQRLVGLESSMRQARGALFLIVGLLAGLGIVDLASLLG
jgi:hypothetical protein